MHCPIGGFLPYLLLSLPEHPEKIPSVSNREGRRMTMKQNSKTELLTLKTASGLLRSDSFFMMGKGERKNAGKNTCG